jgi:transposase
MMSTPADEYATDLTDAQWRLIKPLLPASTWPPGGPGRPRRDPRQIINGLLYLTKTGCPWALLPASLGPWKTVYDYFRRWSLQGVWPPILDRLTQRERRRQGRLSTPSAGGVDSQTIKTATQGETIGYDAGKKIKGRKRHLWVDTLGWIRPVEVTAADVGDRDGLKRVLTRYVAPGLPRLRKLWVNGGSAGADLKGWVADLKKTHKIDLEVVAKQGNGFTPLKRRWVVERTFAWLMNVRRHARDYEVLTRHSEALIQIAMIYLLLKRLA